MSRPRILDLFCGAGGSAVGYHRAGFDVVGVDIKPQPRYPFLFVQGDALEYLAKHGHLHDAAHASPPCQRFSTATRHTNRERHPDLLDTTRLLLIGSKLPYVIENVVGAPLCAPILLCGTMFDLKVYRHRLFECSFPVNIKAHPAHRDNCHGNNMISRNGFVNVFGGGGHTEYKRKAMGIDWMTRDELSQAIPPAYTEFIGTQLLRVVNNRADTRLEA